MARSARKQKRSAVVPAMAAGVLLLIAAMIVGVLYAGKLKFDAEDSGSTHSGAKDEQPAGEADPFAPELEQPTPEPPADQPVDPFASLDDPFADALSESVSTRVPKPGELTGSSLWQGAMETAGRVPGRLMLATEAREKGKPVEARDYRREAAAILEGVLETTDAWMRDVVGQYDPTDLQVRSVVSLRQKWIDQLAKLKAEDAD